MTVPDRGGDSPCWAHELAHFDDDPVRQPVVVDLGTAVSGSGGVIWSLPHGDDLDANLVRLGAGHSIAEHVNNEVDVLVFVQSGSAGLSVDGVAHTLGSDHLALIPSGSRRSLQAGPAGVTYLSVHRRRGPLGISPHPNAGDAS